MNRREIERRRKRIAAIKRKIKLDVVSEKPAKASNYLNCLAEYYISHPDMQAILCNRVSGRTQGKNKNLNTHMEILKKALNGRNIPIVGYFNEVSSGWILDEKRQGLMRAVKEAKKKKNAVIVATSADRFLRNKNYTTNEPDLLPTESEYEELKNLTCDVPLVTLLHPDMPSDEVRGLQSKWGQKIKGNKGGRPRKVISGYKKQLRLKKLNMVIQLNKKGKNISQIATKTGIARSTIKDWLVKYS